MKTNRILTMLGVSAALVGNQAIAQGHGSGGGGQAVRTAQGYELRDLIARTCLNQDGAALLDSMPELKERIDAIKKVHWYFGFALEREFRSMNFCFTDADFNPLMLPRVDGPESLLVVTAPGSTVFVAVRLFESREAYVKNQIYSRLSARSKAMTLLHETLHSFIPLHVADRNIRLRDFVNLLAQLDPNQAASASLLDSSMRFNRIQFPSRSAIKQDAPYLEFVFGSDQQQRTAWLDGSMTLQKLLSPPRVRLWNELLDQDRTYLGSIEGKEAELFLTRYCEADDQEVITRLRTQSNDRFDIDLFCFSVLSSQGKFNRLPSETTLSAIRRKLDLIYAGILGAEVKVHRERVLISGGIRALSQANGNLANATTALSLRPIRSLAPQAELSGETRIWINVLISLAHQLDANQWASLIGRDGVLKRALDESQLTQKLQTLNVPMNDEKQELLKLIPVLFESFKESVESELRLNGLESHADAWKQMLTK